VDAAAKMCAMLCGFTVEWPMVRSLLQSCTTRVISVMLLLSR